MKHDKLIPHLFRKEYRKIVSVLCQRFGFNQIEVAEDIAGETFLIASQTWSREGVPDHPEAWLFRVAKNRAVNHIKRTSIFRDKITPQLKEEKERIEHDDFDIDLSPQNINDSQLQMMFAICQPAISPEAQIGLSLQILCGFGIEEIANAFLTNRETITKRLYRARKKLRDEKVEINLPGSEEIDKRLDMVLTTIYLLFNEGYHSASKDHILRKDLCLEAMRLCYMLTENEATCRPDVYALLALFSFQASRFEARIDNRGEQVLYHDQNTELWNYELISKGSYYLKKSARGEKVSAYHLEASIAWWHTQKIDSPEKWKRILRLYNQLLQIQYSPIAAMNRTFALSKVEGKIKAIKEAEKLKLTDNHFYSTFLGVLYTGLNDKKAAEHFKKALSLAKSDADRHIIQKKMDCLNSGG